MYINCVFNMHDTLSEPSFELKSIFIRQLFLVVTNSINHGSKHFILFMASDIEVSEVSNAQLFHNVI